MRHGCIPLSLLIGLWMGCTVCVLHAGEVPSTPQQFQFFETRIRPLLASQCYQCHGPDKQKSELRLDSRESLRKGGASGPVIVPGQPESSRLIKAIEYRDESLRMPPKQKLADRQIADLKQWVKMGAPYPSVVVTDKGNNNGRQFWAFEPPVDPPLPMIKEASWPQAPLDHFTLAKLEANGLHPAPPADKRTLLRRATFDLTGLPPTPEEIEAFLADRSPEAFARVVDRLLASVHYGERWGRHWLDVVRYADSNGLDENIALGNAFRYRDYVIAAFNRDKPYDQFLLEQLAGDLLPAADTVSRHEHLIATGFLSLGPKVLAEVDEKKMEMDIIDEQVDTLGRAVLGLTLGCARCHDHKFDPIPTEDYYALAGIFKSTRTMEHYTKIARWYENSLASEPEQARKAAHDKKIAQKKEAVQALLKKANAQLKATAKSSGAPPKNAEELFPEETRKELKRLRDELAQLEKTAPEIPSAIGVTEGKVGDLAIHIRGSHLKLGPVVPRHFPRVLSGPHQPPLDSKQSGRLQLAQWLVQRDHPLTSRVLVNRLWRWHFGQGLTRTTDNFGKLGEPPVNQPLLDWLAHRLVENRWSIKAMHRLIMLSSTYQLSAAADAKTLEVDPENRLHGRSEVRRLEAEAIRDTLLFISNTLDPAMGGSMLHVKNREFLFDHTSKDMTRYDSKRRSLYLPVIRNHLYDVFQLFDFTDATVLSGDRATTTVAPQALFMMNSDLVAQAAEKLADGLLQGPETADAARLQRLYLKTYGRNATSKETAEALALLESFEQVLRAHQPDAGKRRWQAWTFLCQVIVMANEFVYIS